MTVMPHTSIADSASSPQSPPVGAAELRAWIVRWVAGKLGVTPGEIDPDVPLIDLGLDSLAALELSGRLETLAQREVSPLIVREHPSIAAISAFLTEPLPPTTPGMSPLPPEDTSWIQRT
jgi:acyl carrier protein